jgi:hypothetical protein
VVADVGVAVGPGVGAVLTLASASRASEAPVGSADDAFAWRLRDAADVVSR